MCGCRSRRPMHMQPCSAKCLRTCAANRCGIRRDDRDRPAHHDPLTIGAKPRAPLPPAGHGSGAGETHGRSLTRRRQRRTISGWLRECARVGARSSVLPWVGQGFGRPGSSGPGRQVGRRSPLRAGSGRLANQRWRDVGSTMALRGIIPCESIGYGKPRWSFHERGKADMATSSGCSSARHFRKSRTQTAASSDICPPC